MVVGIKIEIGHQLSLHIVDGFCQCVEELVKVFLVQEYFVPVIAIVIKTFFTFCDSKKVVVSPSGLYIKEVCSSFTRFQSFRKDAIIVSFLLIVVFVRHS
jgi:hypothetical protein